MESLPTAKLQLQSKSVHHLMKRGEIWLREHFHNTYILHQAQVVLKDKATTATLHLQLKGCQFLCYVPRHFYLSRINTTNYRPQGKVIFSQVSVCPQSASWLLVHCSTLLNYSAVGTHPAGMLSCYKCNQVFPRNNNFGNYARTVLEQNKFSEKVTYNRD